MCFSAGLAIGGAIGGVANSGNASIGAGASLEAVELATRVSRELHDHWKAYYSSCDAATVSEVCAIPKYVAPVATISGRARLEVIRTIGRKRQQLYRGQNVFHVGKMAQDCNVLAAVEASAALDASEWGYRRGQNLEIQRNQQRLENIYAYLGLGRNLLSNSLGAAALAGAIANQLGAEQGKSIAGWSQFLGFLQSKEGRQFGKDILGAFGIGTAGERAPRLDDWSGAPIYQEPAPRMDDWSGGAPTEGSESESLLPSTTPQDGPNYGQASNPEAYSSGGYP